jgi:hypothetical protein
MKVKADEATPIAVEALIDRVFKAIEGDPKTANDILRKHAGGGHHDARKSNPRGFWASGPFSSGSTEKGDFGTSVEDQTETVPFRVSIPLRAANPSIVAAQRT